jgi:hypothetical protein
MGTPRTHPMRNRILGLLALALLTGPTSTMATTIIFDTGAPIGTFHSPDGILTANSIVAATFPVGENATLTGAGVYVRTGGVGIPTFSTWDGTLEYFLYANDIHYDVFGKRADIPGALLASGNALNVVMTDTGVQGFWLLEFDFEADLGVTAGGSYWLGIHTADDYFAGDPGDCSQGLVDCSIQWVTLPHGAPSARDYLGDGDFMPDYPRFNYTVALFITGDLGCDIDCHPPDVPEPGTLALLGLGLAGIGFTRGRRAS